MVGTSARGVASRNGPHKKAARDILPAPLSFNLFEKA
jgi:hypothetical protein